MVVLLSPMERTADRVAAFAALWPCGTMVQIICWCTFIFLFDARASVASLVVCRLVLILAHPLCPFALFDYQIEDSSTFLGDGGAADVYKGTMSSKVVSLATMSTLCTCLFCPCARITMDRWALRALIAHRHTCTCTQAITRLTPVPQTNPFRWRRFCKMLR